VQLRGHGVALVGTIEERPTDAVVDPDFDALVLVLGHFSLLVVDDVIMLPWIVPRRLQKKRLCYQKSGS
jgi:hypothetical protein